MTAELLNSGYELVPVESVHLHPRNARKGVVADIVKSIRANGFYGVLVVQRSTGHILVGNHRYQAAVACGITSVPVTWVDVDNKRALKILAVDNRTNDLATYDFPALLEVLKQFEADGDFDGSGYEADDIDAVLKQIAKDTPAVEVEEDEPGDPPPDPKTRPGDVYELGDHRLICGDSCDVTVWAKLMEGALADLVWTDPPYGVSYVGGTGLTIQNDELVGDKLYEFLVEAFRSVHVKPGCAIYVASPAGRNCVEFYKAFLAAGWRLHQTLIWKKSSLVLGHSDYHFIHEPILYGYAPGGGRRGRGGDGWYGDDSQTSVIECDKPKKNPDHPTMKPIELVAQAINNSSRPGDIVADLFGGSGTTLIAAEQTGRRARLVELSPQYCDVIVARWEKLTGRTAKLV